MGIVEFLADLGGSIERHMSSAGVCILLIILSMIFHWAAVLLVILLAANIYIKARGKVPKELSEVEVKPPEIKPSTLMILIGLAMIVGGAWWLIKDLLLIEIPGEVGLIVLGLLLVIAGTITRSEWEGGEQE